MTASSVRFVCLVCGFIALPSFAQELLRPVEGNDTRVLAPDAVRSGVAPNQRVEAPAVKRHRRGPAIFPLEFRSIDGRGNNGRHPEWGAADVELVRITLVGYEDGASSPSGYDRPNPREISNICVAQGGSLANPAGASDYLWQWGQFVDHDIDLSPFADPAEPFDVAVPGGDPWFDPAGTGTQTIPLSRSHYRDVDGVRQQINAITAYIDASMVYGSDEARAQELRTLDGTGRLKTSAGDLLPFNTGGFPNAPGPDPSFFLAGDERANEQVGLTALHTLFVREHNYWAAAVAGIGVPASGEVIYQTARAIVAAEIQAITYREFLPLLLGRHGLSRYRGYDPSVNAGIANVFATAAYRVGHSMLSPQLLRLDEDGQEIAAGHLPLAQAFFSPGEVIDHGIDPLLRGLAGQLSQQIDPFIVDGVRNFLFGPPGSGGLDLASLNIQRGRDHGLPSYNQARTDYGLPPVASFAEINPDPQVQANLADAYGTVDAIDIWVGGLSEVHVPGALVGETFHAILADQFERLRDGDRFWYQTYMGFLAPIIERQTLARIIRRNSGIGGELPGDVFRTPGS